MRSPFTRHCVGSTERSTGSSDLWGSAVCEGRLVTGRITEDKSGGGYRCKLSCPYHPNLKSINVNSAHWGGSYQELGRGDDGKAAAAAAKAARP